MKNVVPEIYLISKPEIDWNEVRRYLESIGGEGWLDRVPEYSEDADGQTLVEIGGRLCYRSWEPGLNKNVTRIRTDQASYLNNLLKSGHGSVLEHANYTFIIANVSRVFTHELVRHRVGVAISQESLRYVRSDDIKFWAPDELLEDGELPPETTRLLAAMEDYQKFFAERNRLDDSKDFEYKKRMTSAARRLLPQGMATDMQWTANIRTLRHCIEMRTAVGAETEMRYVFDLIADVMRMECPLLFGDYVMDDRTVDANGGTTFETQFRKV